MAEKDPDFAALMIRVQEGSAKAFQQLHDEYGTHLLRAVRRRLAQRLRSKFDSLDFVQDVWASFCRQIPQGRTFASPDDLVRFLAAMARYKVAEVTRQRLQRQKYNLNRERHLESETYFKEGARTIGPTVSEVAMGREEWDQLLENQRPVHKKILLLLREGQSSERIAEELGISQRTVTRVIRKVFPEPQS